MDEWMEVVATSDDGQYRAILMYDMGCESPITRDDWWTTSVLTFPSRWYVAGVEAPYDPENRIVAWREFNDLPFQNPDVLFIRYMRLTHGIEVHQVNWGSANDRALAWLEPSVRRRAGISNWWPDSASIEMDVNEYNEWASGECYGYIVQERVTWHADASGVEVTRETWEDTDESRWGLIGHEYAEGAALAALNYLANRDRL